MDEVKIYIYGSCHISEPSNSNEQIGNGGYGVVISTNGKRTDSFSTGFSNTSNARIDILGITEGLKRIQEPSNITVYLNNGYVIDTLTKGWLERWRIKEYRNKKHSDLWKELDKILLDNCHSLSFKKAKDIKYISDFKLAEHLGKIMSGKKNLPPDMKLDNEQLDFSKNTNIENNILEIVDDKPILESISVDASCIGNPGFMEYRGVDTNTKEIIFSAKYQEGTNNVGEFLAIVYALALYKKEGKELGILYTDSLIAITWVKQKKCKTKLERNDKNNKTFEHIERALKWLESNEFDTKILKWNTNVWGEIPADYGRKNAMYYSNSKI